jgi:hypothetical protein
MDLLTALLASANATDLEQLGSQFNLDKSSLDSVLNQVVPALGRGIQNNTRASGGLESLMGALQNGEHERYLNDLSEVTSLSGIADGNNILGHVFGSKDVSRNVAAHASQNSGVSPDIIKQMLPMIATMVMGAISKQTADGAQAAHAGSGDLGSMLSSVLDSDGDGSPVDDILDMAKRIMRP